MSSSSSSSSSLLSAKIQRRRQHRTIISRIRIVKRCGGSHVAEITRLRIVLRQVEAVLLLLRLEVAWLMDIMRIIEFSQWHLIVITQNISLVTCLARRQVGHLDASRVTMRPQALAVLELHELCHCSWPGQLCARRD